MTKGSVPSSAPIALLMPSEQSQQQLQWLLPGGTGLAAKQLPAHAQSDRGGCLRAARAHPESGLGACRTRAPELLWQ